jgi:hypothetical protein
MTNAGTKQRWYNHKQSINNSGTINNSRQFTNIGHVNNATVNNDNVIDNTSGTIKNICTGVINGNPPQGKPVQQIPCTPDLTIADVTRVEGNVVASSFDFIISISTPAPPGGVEVTYQTADDTAKTADDDYRSNSGIVIPEGQSSMFFSILVIGNNKFEPNEAFFCEPLKSDQRRNN